MADSILRLRVSSEEYDNKLKQAAQELTRYVDQCRKVGGTLEYVEKETLEYVRALGQMDTTSRTATGKLAEMKKAFVEFSAQYKQMTDAEKNSPFGKALAESLDQLKGRIQEGKSQLDDINKSINGGGGLTGALDSLSEKFGMSVESLAGWGTALAAGKAALDVAKDAFFASEETVDEWGRVMDSSKSLYEGFLTALNTGDISGFLSRIDSIVQAARAAYNELDRLGTMKTIQAPQMSAQQTENERMRMMIQTGRYIAPVDGRRASMQNGQLLTPDQIKRIEQQLQGGMQKVVTLVGNEVAQTGRAIDAVYNRQAQELGMNLKEFRKGTSSMAEFDKRMAGYDQYQKWRAEHTTIDMKSGREIVARGNPFEQFAKWGTFRVDGDRYNDLVKLIQQRDQQAGQAYSMQSQAYRTMNRAEGVTLRQLMGGGSGGGKWGTFRVDGDRYNDLVKLIQQRDQQAGSLYGMQSQAYRTMNRAEGVTLRQLMGGGSGDGGGRSGGGGGVKEEKDDFEEIIGLIPNAQEAVRSLQQQISQSWDEGEIARLTEDLKEAQAELQRLQNIGKETPMVQGLSGFNQETMSAWMQGRQNDLSKAEYGSPDYSSIMSNIADMNTIKSILEQSVNAGINAAEFNVAPMWDKIFGEALPEGMEGTLSEALSKMYENAFDGMDIDDSAFEALVEKINEKLKDLGIEPIEIPIETTEKSVATITKAANVAANAVGNIGSAFNAIEDPAAKVAGTVMQAIASIALGFAQAASAKDTTASGWAWLAWLAAGTAAMATTIATVHSLTGYAQGGMIKGNSYSGDNIGGLVDGNQLVGLNAGEVVLNAAQQNTLAQSLQGNAPTVRVVGKISGTDIILSADRTLMTQGKQLAVWGM